MAYLKDLANYNRKEVLGNTDVIQFSGFYATVTGADLTTLQRTGQYQDVSNGEAAGLSTSTQAVQSTNTSAATTAWNSNR